MSARLSPLVGLLRSEPALSTLLGADDAAVAVADPARAYVLAGIGSFGSAPVVLVATPTGTEAERVAHDLGAFVDAERVVLFPAWETLPFERVSPGVETMGRRLEALWRTSRARASGEGPVFVVAPVKALVQRLARQPDDVEPITVRRGMKLDPSDLVAALVASGYRREYQVEHRGEVAVRGGIVDVFPSTADSGVRVDCFGDEVDRLTRFDVVDQRSMQDLESFDIFPSRELTVTGERQARAAELADTAPVARDQFARIAEGETFDGIESFLPFLTEEHLLTDFLDIDDRVVLIEPRRMRDRVVELLDEEASLASSLAETWKGEASDAALDASDFPRLHAGFERLLAKCGSKLTSLLAVAEGPDLPTVRVSGWPVSIGDVGSLAGRIGGLVRAGFAVAVAAGSQASGKRIADTLENAGVTLFRDLTDSASTSGSSSLRE